MTGYGTFEMNPATHDGPVRGPGARALDGAVKFTAVTRRLTPEARITLEPRDEALRLGQFVVGRVVRADGDATARDRSGRPVRLYEGDLLVGAWAHRPGDEAPGPTRLLTAGGLVGGSHEPLNGSGQIELTGLVEDGAGGPLSTGAIARMPPRHAIPAIGTIAIVDVSGEDERVASAIVNGWNRAGFAVGAGRATGTETGSHRPAMLDAGAHAIVDFLDFGMPSTHAYPVERQAETMLAVRDALVADGAQIVVLQVDGDGGSAGPALLGRLASIADAVVLCADDEAGARAAVRALDGLALPLRLVAGRIADNAAVSQRVERWAGVPVRSVAAISQAAVGLLAPIEPV